MSAAPAWWFVTERVPAKREKVRVGSRDGGQLRQQQGANGEFNTVEVMAHGNNPRRLKFERKKKKQLYEGISVPAAQNELSYFLCLYSVIRMFYKYQATRCNIVSFLLYPTAST